MTLITTTSAPSSDAARTSAGAARTVGGLLWPTGHRAAKDFASDLVARRSPWLLKLFAAFCARDMASAFHAIRLLGDVPRVEGPMVLVTNHPSWWDAELFAWIATAHFADRRGFAPMDPRNLTRYGFLTRLGAFPVSQGSFAGASAFLAAAEVVLQAPDGLLFVTIEGRYGDVRVRPIRPMPGLAHLARRVPAATFVPLAIDYVFWSERRPNMLLAFGEPLSGAALAAMPTAQAKARLAGALETAMSALAEAGQSRDPQRFRILLKGRDGINFFFDLWRRARAALRGQRFQAAQRAEP